MATLSAIRGDDYQVRFIWKDGDTPINITGYTIVFSLTINRVTVDYDGTPEVTLTPAAGQIDIFIEDEVTEDWGTSGTYKLVVTSPSDLKTTIARGRFEVR